MIGILMATAILGGYLLGQPLSFFDFGFQDLTVSRPINGQVASVQMPARVIPENLGKPMPMISATSAAAYDNASGFGLLMRDPDAVQPIASITKLMTALVFLDHNPGWETTYTVSRKDYREGGKIHVFPGDEVSVRNLFRTALVASDNVAIAALVSASGLDERAFVAEMNAKSRLLRLRHTGFFDPTGLDPRNISTVHDISRFAQVAFNRPEIADALTRSSYDFTTVAGDAKHVVTTDRLLTLPAAENVRIIAGKTGYLPEAGYCFVAQFEKDGKKITTVVLGASDEASRFAETEKMLEWAYESYEWKK